MKRLVVKLRGHMFPLYIKTIIRNLPIYRNLIVKNKLILTSSVSFLSKKKIRQKTENKIILESDISKVNAKKYFSNLTNNSALKESIKVLYGKLARAKETAMVIAQNIPAIQKVRYRLLGEMDFDDDLELTLIEFDDMRVDEVDYIEI